MHVQDRGTMKWVSLMLPEHVEMLQEVFVEYKEKPYLDEQKMMDIDRKLKYALYQNAVIDITYYERGAYESIKGKLKKLEQFHQYILIANEDGTRIPLNNIIDITLV
ncbi:MAG TPA: YolD-like family protein [Pseudogracilibacillus sp.]|nr:YolD-like family protein [Pseudogracilibacillus sp.]